MKRRGFTLTELLTTIAIIAILATVTVVGFVMHITRTQNAKADAESVQINKYIDGMRIIDNTLHVGKSAMGENVYVESIDGIFFLTVEGSREIESKKESFEIDPSSSDLSSMSGKLVITPMEHFYLEEQINGRDCRRYIGTVKYISEDGLERDVPLNNVDLEMLRLELQAKAVEKLLLRLLLENGNLLRVGQQKLIYGTGTFENPSRIKDDIEIRINKRFEQFSITFYIDIEKKYVQLVDGQKSFYIEPERVNMEQCSELKSLLERFNGALKFSRNNATGEYTDLRFVYDLSVAYPKTFKINIAD